MEQRTLLAVLADLDLESRAWMLEEVLPSGKMRSVQLVIAQDSVMTWLSKPTSGNGPPELTLQYKHNYPRILEFQTNDVRKLFMYKYEPLSSTTIQVFRFFSPTQHSVVFDAVMERVAAIAAYLEKLRRKKLVQQATTDPQSHTKSRRRKRSRNSSSPPPLPPPPSTPTPAPTSSTPSSQHSVQPVQREDNTQSWNVNTDTTCDTITFDTITADTITDTLDTMEDDCFYLSDGDFDPDPESRDPVYELDMV